MFLFVSKEDYYDGRLKQGILHVGIIFKTVTPVKYKLERENSGTFMLQFWMHEVKSKQMLHVYTVANLSASSQKTRI